MQFQRRNKERHICFHTWNLSCAANQICFCQNGKASRFGTIHFVDYRHGWPITVWVCILFWKDRTVRHNCDRNWILHGFAATIYPWVLSSEKEIGSENNSKNINQKRRAAVSQPLPSFCRILLNVYHILTQISLFSFTI